MIVMNNVNIHCNARIEKLIILHECNVRYLPSYSSNFNPIELSFSVLKAWVKRHFHEIWLSFENSFGEFLHYAVFALTAAFTMILAATSALALRAASALIALTLSEGFFDLDEVLEKMSESFRDRF